MLRASNYPQYPGASTGRGFGGSTNLPFFKGLKPLFSDPSPKNKKGGEKEGKKIRNKGIKWRNTSLRKTFQLIFFNFFFFLFFLFLLFSLFFLFFFLYNQQQLWISRSAKCHVMKCTGVQNAWAALKSIKVVFFLSGWDGEIESLRLTKGHNKKKRF